MEKQERKLTDYELFVVTIFQNVTQKLLSAIELYGTGYSYNEAFFLSAIAQEELAKLVILPIARELGELDSVLSDKRGAFYKHPIKQKIFMSFGLQNRSEKDIEKLKQEYLYVGRSDSGEPLFKVANPELVRDEIKHACLFMVNQYRNVMGEADFSELTRKGANHFMEIVKSAILEKMPEVDKAISQDSILISLQEKSKTEKEVLNALIMNPYELIRMLKAVFKGEYKKHLKDLGYYSIESFEDYIAQIEL